MIITVQRKSWMIKRWTSKMEIVWILEDGMAKFLIDIEQTCLSRGIIYVSANMVNKIFLKIFYHLVEQRTSNTEGYFVGRSRRTVCRKNTTNHLSPLNYNTYKTAVGFPRCLGTWHWLSADHQLHDMCRLQRTAIPPPHLSHELQFTVFKSK